MNYKITTVLGAAVLVVIIGAGYVLTQNREMRLSDSGESLTVTASSSAITIWDSGVIVKTLTLKDVPSMYQGADEESDSETDYAFYDDPVLDKVHLKVYIAAYDQSGGGNDNADQGLFLYDLVDDSLTLLVHEYGANFGNLHPSPDGRYLVYSEGSRGGMCNSIKGLGAYDLKTRTQLESRFVALPALGEIEFDHWVDDTSFVYTERTFSLEECLNGYAEDNEVIFKTYDIGM